MAEAHSIKKWTPAILSCKQCGQEFIQKQPRQLMFCSKKCGQKHHYANNTERYKALASQQPRHCAVVFCTCKVCDKRFISKRARVTCSDECRKEDARRYTLASSITKHGTKECNCIICGNVFLRQYGDKNRWFCSAECKTNNHKRLRRVYKLQRKARLRTTEIESIDPYDILRRDKWTCQICGKSTPRTLRGLCHADAPEVDHIIPLALGGSHTWENLQCACKSCNARKGATHPDKMLVDQMA